MSRNTTHTANLIEHPHLICRSRVSEGKSLLLCIVRSYTNITRQVDDDDDYDDVRNLILATPFRDAIALVFIVNVTVVY